MKVTTGGPASAVNQGARHLLYVEGNDDGLDVKVLRELLGAMIHVNPLGGCQSLKAVAQALYPYHKDWWFIIDRDHHDDNTVEASWKSFPDPSKHNLLIWRRKELENYLLEPAWLVRCRWIRPGHDQAKLQDMICDAATKRLWLEAANLVLRAVREEVKGKKTELLTTAELGGDDEAHALSAMKASALLGALRGAAGVDLSDAALAQRLTEEAERLSGGQLPLRWDVGRWRDLMPGKELVNEVLRAFNVRDNTKKQVQGREALKAIAQDLFQNHPDGAPDDLLALRNILGKILPSPP